MVKKLDCKNSYFLKEYYYWLLDFLKSLSGIMQESEEELGHSLLKNKYCFVIFPNNSISHGSQGQNRLERIL
jgi:hypothetical protein